MQLYFEVGMLHQFILLKIKVNILKGQHIVPYKFVLLYILAKNYHEKVNTVKYSYTIINTTVSNKIMYTASNLVQFRSILVKFLII